MESSFHGPGRLGSSAARQRPRWAAGCIAAAVALGACADERPAAQEDFSDFWQRFTAAVADDSEAGVRALTRFPFLFENEPRDAAEFGAIYRGLFDATARTCLSRAQPLAEGDAYQVQCGAIVYVFARDGEAWRLAEFTADPEAVEGAGGEGPPPVSPDTWRFVRGSAAPWARNAARVGDELLGARVAFVPGGVDGPAPFGCDGADHEFVVSPAEGLFQGNLPRPAEPAARRIGVARLPLMTLRVTCAAGSYDYHFVASDTLVVAVDDVLWWLAAESAVAGPQRVVQDLLREHMTGDMAFTPALVRPKRAFLSAGLNAAIDAYFARPVPEDEPPPINGDPFTNSQEYPTGFRFRDATADDSSARVAVDYTHEGGGTRLVIVVLRRENGRWAIDDLLYEDGSTFRGILSTG